MQHIISAPGSAVLGPPFLRSRPPRCATIVRDEHRFRVDREPELTENFIKFSFASFVNGSLVEQLGLLGGMNG